MLASRAIINWLHFLGGAKGVKSQPIWGVVCYSFSAGNRVMHLEDLRGCLDDNRVTFAWARVHSCSLSRLYICLHDTPQKLMSCQRESPQHELTLVVVPGREFHSGIM